MRVLVLGSHGCVGKAVVRFFEGRGHTVISWDIKLGDEYDLRKPGVLDPILPSVDFVIFLAFDVGGSKYKINSVNYIENNINILKNTFRSLEAAKKPFLHSSSMMSNMNNNPYAVLKRLGELYTEIVGGINVKLWNVYGSEPVTEKSHVIPDFLSQAISSEKIQMRTSGNEERLFLYCDDFAAALYSLYENYNDFVGKGPVDISSKEWVTIKQMAYIIKDLAKEILQKDIDVLEGDYVDTFHNRKNEPLDSALNSIWSPSVSLKEGIQTVFLSML
ncbi:MAG: NAD-dependent epimerase/dehydratase family protein [Candidatus Planktophila sp.]